MFSGVVHIRFGCRVVLVESALKLSKRVDYTPIDTCYPVDKITNIKLITLLDYI